MLKVIIQNHFDEGVDVLLDSQDLGLFREDFVFYREQVKV